MGQLNFIKAKMVLDNSILAEMDVDVAVNEASQVWVLHDQPFTATPHHIEYYASSGDLYFVAEDGAVKHYGMPVPEKSRAHMAHADTAHLFLVELKPAEKIKEHRAIPITQINTTLEG